MCCHLSWHIEGALRKWIWAWKRYWCSTPSLMGNWIFSLYLTLWGISLGDAVQGSLHSIMRTPKQMSSTKVGMTAIKTWNGNGVAKNHQQNKISYSERRVQPFKKGKNHYTPDSQPTHPLFRPAACFPFEMQSRGSKRPWWPTWGN